MKCRKGEIAVIVGPSGSGKSTSLDILGAIDRPTKGEVFLNDQNIFKYSEDTPEHGSGIERSVLFFSFIICCLNLMRWKMYVCRH